MAISRFGQEKKMKLSHLFPHPRLFVQPIAKLLSSRAASAFSGQRSVSARYYRAEGEGRVQVGGWMYIMAHFLPDTRWWNLNGPCDIVRVVKSEDRESLGDRKQAKEEKEKRNRPKGHSHLLIKEAESRCGCFTEHLLLLRFLPDYSAVFLFYLKQSRLSETFFFRPVNLFSIDWK